MKKLSFISIMLLLVFGFSYPQTGQEGKIQGTVLDDHGIPLPGVTVSISSPSLISPEVFQVTSASGVFRFPSLPPGTYQVSFQIPGFQTLIRKGIIVNASKTTSFNVNLAITTIEEKVTVEGKAPTIDLQMSSKTTTIDSEFIYMVPSPRTLTDFFNMVPGVTDDTAHGSAEISNSYNLDGVNLGDAATGTQGVSFGADIIEEISVETGGLNAEYGHVQGAMVNVITKSGGNKLSGSFSFYLDNEKFQSTNTKGTELEGRKVGSHVAYEPVFTLGGAIIKDKLWFFMHGSAKINEEYETGYPADKEEEIPIRKKKYYPYFKLTYQPNMSNRFILSYNFYDNRDNHKDAYYTESEESTRIQMNPSHIFNFHWTHFFNQNFYWNLKLAMIQRNFNIDAKIIEPYYWDYLTEIGTGGYWRNKDDYVRDRYQANFDATLFVDDFAGSHEVKFGAEFTMFKSTWLIETVADPNSGACWNGMMGDDYYVGYQITGYDRKEDVMDFHAYVQDTWNVSNRLILNLGLRFEYNSLWWPAQGSSEPLTYNEAGWDISVVRQIEERTKVYGWKNFAPRVGVIYDVSGSGTTLLKGSYSRMIIPNQLGYVNISHPNGWFGMIEYYNPDGSAYYAFPWNLPGEGAPTIGHPDYPLVAPYQDEITIGIERELFEDWSLSARYIKKWDRKLVHVVDSAQLDLGKLMENGELDWVNWRPVATDDPYDNQQITFYEMVDPYAIDQYILNPPNAKRDYDGLELILKKRFSKGWQLMASYVYQNSRGLVNTDRGEQSLGTSNLFNNPNVHINMIGRFPLERRHMFKLQSMIRGPFGINLGTYVSALSGQRYTRQVRSQDLPITLSQGNETIFAEERGSSHYDPLYLVDLRLEKSFQIGDSFSIAVFTDAFNLFNVGTIDDVYTISSNENKQYGLEEGIVNPRIIRIGAKIEW
jgi:outer membrane receptor protein involved in Fe transport